MHSKLSAHAYPAFAVRCRSIVQQSSRRCFTSSAKTTFRAGICPKTQRRHRQAGWKRKTFTPAQPIYLLNFFFFSLATTTTATHRVPTYPHREVYNTPRQNQSGDARRGAPKIYIGDKKVDWFVYKSYVNDKLCFTLLSFAFLAVSLGGVFSAH